MLRPIILSQTFTNCSHIMTDDPYADVESPYLQVGRCLEGIKRSHLNAPGLCSRMRECMLLLHYDETTPTATQRRRLLLVSLYQSSSSVERYFLLYQSSTPPIFLATAWSALAHLSVSSRRLWRVLSYLLLLRIISGVLQLEEG